MPYSLPLSALPHFAVLDLPLQPNISFLAHSIVPMQSPNSFQICSLPPCGISSPQAAFLGCALAFRLFLPGRLSLPAHNLGDLDEASSLQEIGTFAQVHSISRLESGQAQVLLYGHRRLRRRHITGTSPLQFAVEHLKDQPYNSKDDVVKVVGGSPSLFTRIPSQCPTAAAVHLLCGLSSSSFCPPSCHCSLPTQLSNSQQFNHRPAPWRS